MCHLTLNGGSTLKALKTRKCPKTDTVLLDYPILAQKCYDEAYDPNFKLKMCRYIFLIIKHYQARAFVVQQRDVLSS